MDRFKSRPRILIISDDAETPVKTLNITIKDEKVAAPSLVDKLLFWKR
jgi:hypothetical protein